MSPAPRPRPTSTWPAIAIASRTNARKIQSWKAIWCAASEASPNRAITAPASVNALSNAVVRTKMWRPITSSRRISSRDTPRVTSCGTEDDNDERRAHPRLRDHGPPRRALDPPAEAVDEQHLEHDVDGVRGDHDHERRLQVGDPAQVPLPAEREERERKPERRDPHVRDGVVGRVAVAAHQLDDLRRERDHTGGDREAEAERQPERLRTEAVRDRRLPRSRGAPDLRRRPVLEEVEDAEETAEDDGRDPERRQLGPAEVADDRRVDEEIERLGGQRAERRHREPQDLAVVLAAKTQATRRGRCGRRSIARAP